MTNPDAEGRLPHHRPAQGALEPGLEGQEPERDRPEAARTHELSLFGPGTDSGTFDFFTDEINGEEGVSREDYQPSEDDNVLVQGVEGEAGGLGYFGFSYYEQNQDKLNLVGVDAGDGCVKPNPETIQTGDYKPLARPLFMYPEREGAEAARGQGVHGLRDRELRGHRGGLADRRR